MIKVTDDIIFLSSEGMTTLGSTEGCMIKLTEDRILLEYWRGLDELAQHPCSLCRATNHDFKKYPHFHGSDFGRCVRSIQFDKLVAKDPFDQDSKALLRDGHVHEAAIVEILRAAGLKIDHRHDAPEGQVQTDEFIVTMDTLTGNFWTLADYQEAIKVSDNNEIDEDTIIVVGHTDGVINDEYLLECKAVKDWAFANKFKMRNYPPNYVAQMRTYMYFLDLLSGFLFAKSRHTSQIRVGHIKRNDRQIIKKAQELRQIVDHLHSADWLKCKPLSPDEKKFCRACRRL
jgi:hypothetical protein